MADSRHNKYVSVTDWFKPAPGSTTSGTASGSTGAATSGASFVGGSWGSGGSGGGSTITIIKTNDTTPESNSNVYSALRVHNSFIAKDKDERTEGKLSSDAGFEVGEFVSGASGAICYIDPETLQTTAELDRLKVRIKAYFETLEITNVNSVGGKQIISPAGSINCIRVDEHGGTIDILKERQATDEEGNPLYDINGNPIMETYIESVDNGVPEDTYRCYFLAELDGETIENRFHVGDQAYSQMFDAQPGVSSNVSSKYYWRLVTGISYDPIEIAGKKYHYIDLSVSDCDTDSDAPSVGDIICHRGHRTLPGDIEGRDRQNALEFSAVDTFSPSITLYQGIGESDPDNGKYPYSLVGKDIIQYGVNRLNNRAFMNVYGDMYVGDRDGQSYLQFDETAGLTVKGNIQFGSKSKMDGDDLTLEERIELASKAYEEDVNQFKAAVEKSFLDVLNQIDGAIESYFLDPEPTLENEPAIDWNTDSIKASHVGDLYYSKQGNAYRFQYDEITDADGSKYNLFYWNLIKDTDITLALANAQKAQDTADSKRKIFVKQPSTNDSYEEGDMWANATYPTTGVPKYSNDLLRAVTSKQAGEPFSIDHWVLSSKYTDDTAAIAAQEAADEAQRVANNAQSDATAAANRLSSWAADNVISPTEKQGIKEEYVRVIKDKDSIHEQWDLYFLDTTDSTEIGKIYIAYNNAYLPYVEQLIYLFTAKDSDGVALENIPIPDDFDDNQTAYYSNRAIALNTIAAAAKKVADDAQAAANNAYEEAEKALTAAEEAKTSVYGLNTTVTGLKDFTDDAFLDGIINSSERKTIENYIYQINTVLAQVQQSYSEVVDNTFLVESVAKTNLENSYNSFITATNELLQTVNVISSQGSVENIDRAGFEVKYNNFNSKYSDYTKYLNAAIKFIEYAINSRVDTTLQELGGYSYLKNAFNEETTVTGGLVLTSLVALGYTDDNQQYHVMGGINGSHSNNDGIAIWAGGSAIDRAIEPNNPNAADFLVRMDGTGYAAGGNFWWESDGTIHADPLSFVISETSVGALLSSLKVYYNVTDGKPSPYALEPLVPFTKLTIASDIELNSNARIALGDVYIAYDPENKAIYFADSKGGVVNFYTTGGMSMFGQGNISVNSIMDAISLNLDPNTLTIQNGVLTVIGGGTGGGGSIDYALSWSGFSSGSYDGSSAKTIYIPSKLSELTNDSGYALSSALSGYLPLSGGTITGDLSLNQYLRINAWSGYGTGSANLWYDGTFRTVRCGDVDYISLANGEQVLHSSNYSSYALPLTGGVLSGDLYFGNASTGSNSTGTRTRLPSHLYRNVYDNSGDVYDHYYNGEYTASTYTFANLRVKTSGGIKVLRFGGDGTFTWDGNNVIHSGNIGSQSVSYATNADKLDGLHLYSPGSGTGGVAYIGGDGVMEISSIIDFRSNNSDGNDFNTRLYSTGSYKNQVQLPTSSGTLALTTDNVASATKLENNDSYTAWGQTFFINGKPNSFNGTAYFPNGDLIYAKDEGGANQYVLGFTSSLGLGYGSAGSGYDTYVLGNNVYLRYSTSRITGFTLNSSGNVGIGTTTPACKLDINGRLRVQGWILADSYVWFSKGSEGIYISRTSINWHGTSENWVSSLIDFSSSSVSIGQPTTLSSTLSVSGATTLKSLSATSGSFSDGLTVTKSSNNVASFKSTNAIGVVSLLGNGTYGTRLDISNSKADATVISLNYDGTISAVTGSFSGDVSIGSNAILANNKGICIKNTSGTAQDVVRISGSNNLVFGVGSTDSGINTYLDGNNVYIRYGTKHTTGLTLASDGQITFDGLGIFNKSIRTYNSSGGDTYIELNRNTNASWQILNSSGDLKFRNNWVNGVKGDYFDAFKLSYQTGNAWLKGSLTVASTSTFTGATTHNGGISSTTGSFSGALTAGSTLSVSSTSTFTGNTTNKAIAYFANGTTYYVNASGAAKFASLTSAGAISGTSGSFSSTLAVTSTSTFTGKTTHNGGIGATSGTFSSTLAVTGATTLSSSLSVGSSLTVGTVIQAESIELVHSTPHIDFRFNKSTANYTSRFIEGLSGQLTCMGKFRIGLNYTTSTDYNFYVSGSAYISSNLLTGGSITMNSMRSMKNIINEVGLSLEELSTIKPTRFTWKDGRDDRIHVGGIADDVMKVLPEVVFKGNDGVLSMDYASAAFVMAASLIQPMTEHERRIANLERENALLKEEIRNLKSA